MKYGPNAMHHHIIGHKSSNGHHDNSTLVACGTFVEYTNGWSIVACNCMSCATCFMQLCILKVACVRCNWKLDALHMTIANDMISISERMIWLFSKRVQNTIAKLQTKTYSTYMHM